MGFLLSAVHYLASSRVTIRRPVNVYIRPSQNRSCWTFQSWRRSRSIQTYWSDGCCRLKKKCDKGGSTTLVSHLILLESFLRLSTSRLTSWLYHPPNLASTYFILGNTPPRQDSSRAREEQKREKKHLESVRDATKKAARKGKSVILDGLTVAANVGDVVTESAQSTIRGGTRRSRTHYDESAVAPVWDEINDGES